MSNFILKLFKWLKCLEFKPRFNKWRELPSKKSNDLNCHLQNFSLIDFNILRRVEPLNFNHWNSTAKFLFAEIPAEDFSLEMTAVFLVNIIDIKNCYSLMPKRLRRFGCSISRSLLRSLRSRDWAVTIRLTPPILICIVSSNPSRRWTIGAQFLVRYLQGQLHCYAVSLWQNCPQIIYVKKLGQPSRWVRYIIGRARSSGSQILFKLSADFSQKLPF